MVTSEPDSSTTKTRSFVDSVRGVISGSGAAKVLAASATLFEAGGKHVLPEATKAAVRGIAERSATRAIAIASGPLFEPVAMLGAKPAPAPAVSFARGAAKGIGVHATRLAAKEILKGAGKAAGLGFVLDGAIAGVEAIVAVRGGTCDGKTAVKHVAMEATTGAVATGAGVLLGAGLVALTGGLATPVVFAVGALGAVGTKTLLRRLTGAGVVGAALSTR
jgi:hypothetical protein